jgi:hypothetical protein
MHQCEQFRERISEDIIDRVDLTSRSEIQSELLRCLSCSDFYTESRAMMDALSAVEFNVSEDHLEAMNYRLRMSIINERTQASTPSRKSRIAWDFGIPAFGALAAVLLITAGLYRVALPVIEDRQPSVSTQQTLMDYTVNLDPVTLSFLEQSELLLRNVMKLDAANVEDLEDAKQLASRHLMNLNKRMEAASDIPPVLTVMGKYETVLRDIRNMKEETAVEDIIDIQSRIEKNGLIANMKAFQPSVTIVDVEQ